jgi:hypothetical protein
MADLTVTLTGSDLNPYVPPTGFAYPTGSVNGRIFGGAYCSTSASTAAVIYQTEPASLSSADIVLHSVGSDAQGLCWMDTNGDGYFLLVRNFDLRVGRATATNTGLTILSGGTYTGTMVIGDRIRWYVNKATGQMQIYQGANLRLTVTDTTHTAKNLRLGWFSRGNARVTSFTLYDIALPPAITSINSGNPIRVGAPSVTAAHTDFTGAITSITTNRTGLTASVISGDADSTTFSISDWDDGEQYPELDSTVTFTFSRSGESAAADQTVTYPADWEKVTFTDPINDDPRLFGEIFTDAGFTTLNAVLYYDTSTIDGLVINSDTSGDPLDEGGTFGAWLRPVSGTGAGEMFYFELTIAEDGGAVTASIDSVGTIRIGGTTPITVSGFPGSVTAGTIDGVDLSSASDTEIELSQLVDTELAPRPGTRTLSLTGGAGTGTIERPVNPPAGWAYYTITADFVQAINGVASTFLPVTGSVGDFILCPTAPAAGKFTNVTDAGVVTNNVGNQELFIINNSTKVARSFDIETTGGAAGIGGGGSSGLTSRGLTSVGL